MEMRGFYSLDKPGDFSFIQDLRYIAAMIHPGGGRNDIPNRLKRQFSIFNCTLPSNSSLDQIFGVICRGYFCRSRFRKAMVEFMPTLVELTRVFWQRVKSRMLPTPAKFHYVFNLRDISRIWQGILTIQDAELRDKTTALKLWRHECTRVIADKLTTAEDRLWLDETLSHTAEELLGEDFAHYNTDECYFVDFMREAPEPTGDEPDDACLDPPKIYEEVPDFDYLKKWLVFYMDGYNQTVRSGFLDLVLFHDAIMHLCIISRIIRAPRGSALLVGVGGSGKQSITKLATFIAGYKSYQISITRTYNVTNLLEDLKYLYRLAGLEGKGVSFIFTDNEIKDESFLEYINNVLSAGEVANLFPRDEMDDILDQLIPIMKKEDPKRPPTRDNLNAYFFSRARANLHIVLCFSPVGEKFRARALKFPGLISGCTIDWFFRWPKDALVAVSQHYLANFDIVCTPEVKESLMELMGVVHDNVAECCASYYEKYRRQTHVTPKSFLFFLDAYKSIYTERNSTIAALQSRMSSGLSKLAEAVVSVEELQKEMRVMEKDLAVSTAAANDVLAAVTVQVNETEKVKADVQAVAASQQELVDAIDADRSVANERLEAARPALEAAENALLTIKATDIATVRKLAKPPYLITVIMDVVMVLFGRRLDSVKPDHERQFMMPSWSEALKVVADVNFLKRLQQFPKDMINEETIDLMGPYLNNPLYTFENAKTACGNVAGLLLWTVAMAQFYGINKEVLPLKAKVAVAEAKLETAKRKLAEAEAVLAEKEKDLNIQKERHAEAMAAKQVVQDQADQCSDKINLAQGLIGGLAGERIRWQEQLGLFWSEIQRNVGDVLLLTGFLSYAGPFNQEFRTVLQRDWLDELVQRRIPVSGNIKVTDCLADQATTSEWNLQGLPSDELSIQNGIIVTKASRFPLLIDPQGQGKVWIKNKEKDYDLQITSLNHKYFRNHLEDCLGLGRPLLIEDVLEELDPCLDNVLERNYIKIANSYKVKVGDKEVEVNTAFRLYITTKLPNPSYTPEISARTSIIDFAVNFKGLEDQLLGRVILGEKREMEMERINLVTGITENRRKIQNLESNLLLKLTTVQGSLVDDPSVMEMLNVTKNTAQEVQKKLAVADETEKKINAAREEYRPVATRGSVLYFLVVEMASVNCMYQTSLLQFLERFDISLERSQKSPIAAKRIGFIIDYLTLDVFRFKCRGLYENDKFLFVLLMALKVDLQRVHITSEEFQTFLKGKAFLPDRTLAQSRKYVMSSLGPQFAEPVITNLEAMLGESRPLTPMVCFLSMGSDPTPGIESLAKKMGTACRNISMGQGQEVHARKLVQSSMEEGGWVLLQNCHLGLEYMVELTLLLNETETVDLNFRLFITTEVSPQFPISLLQISIKFTYDPPQGAQMRYHFIAFWGRIRAGLKSTYSNMDQELLEFTSMPQWIPLLFTVSFLHTVVQERRKFGPLGWNIPYEFNSSDWYSSTLFIQNHLEDMDPKRGISWSTVRYMIGEVMYGGRVTDDLDKRLLNTFAKVWFSDKLFEENFQFYAGYPVVKFPQVEQYLTYIEEMSPTDPPMAYGLHSNADITYQTSMTTRTLSTIVSVQPKESSGGGGDTREQVVTRLVQGMQASLPSDYDGFQAEGDEPPGAHEHLPEARDRPHAEGH
ncbi:dynein axonemal heavy chain 8-like [Frankliniella occidentalis]|uniref:Dynein axonemal heavy chain 8-like n=1 Tax=Frankliniella occidentalis TaxID=133901 RepID=A0A9C6X4K2_FRAOC|nr:dynein axonemal heavy chain 8-like [Frankliniella occidentalis]